MALPDVRSLQPQRRKRDRDERIRQLFSADLSEKWQIDVGREVIHRRGVAEHGEGECNLALQLLELARLSIFRQLRRRSRHPQRHIPLVAARILHGSRGIHDLPHVSGREQRLFSLRLDRQESQIGDERRHLFPFVFIRLRELELPRGIRRLRPKVALERGGIDTDGQNEEECEHDDVMIARGALRLYALAQRSGLLRTRAGDALFSRAYFAYKRLLEDPFARLVRTSPDLFTNGHIVDVGANIGYTTAVFARAVRPPFRVFAFEPEEENFARLQRNVRRLGLRNVELVRTAAGDRDGVAQLIRNPAHPGDHKIGRSDVDVPITTLDSFAAAHIDGPIAFVKIDVQGFEPAVLAGMSRILDANPSISLAVEVSEPDLAFLGYTVDDELRPLVERGFRSEPISRRREYQDLLWRRS